jgi:3-oxoadipate enol-lactonase
MDKRIIKTSLGDIHVHYKEVKGTIPVLFLHGVYFDHNLWMGQTTHINNRTVLTPDMPLHGKSKNLAQSNWTLDDCATMIIEILDAMKIEKVFAIGHSWGSMTILRAANKHPERFVSIGLCNMPFMAGTSLTRLRFSMQHLLLPFRKFYTLQVAKAIYGKLSLSQNPELLEHLRRSMNSMKNWEIKQTDKSVIMNAENTEPLIRTLQVPALALKGEDDYVPSSEFIKTILVKGGHVSPLEAPEDVFEFIRKVMILK